MSTGIKCSACGSEVVPEAAFCPSCGDPLATVVIAGEMRVAQQSLSVEVDRLYRERLARAMRSDFEVRRQIGSGGFGVVYEAFDKQLARSLAVKVLRHEMADTGLSRFMMEARVVASLRHPGIVPIHFVGEGEGLVFMTMPLLEGETLRDRLKRGPCAPHEARRIMREVCAALQASHSHGVVHRDLKPENIFLESPGDRVVLMDFGIAKLGEASSGTESGAILGTPAYMSPEQFSGEKALGPASDIYALGIVGYELMAGRLPFAGPTIQDLLFQHLTAHPDPAPLQRSGQPEASVEAVLRCLEKAPVRRPASAEELAEAFQEQRAESEKSQSGGVGLTTMAIIGLCLLPHSVLSWYQPVHTWLSQRDSATRSGILVELLGILDVLALIAAAALSVPLVKRILWQRPSIRRYSSSLAREFGGPEQQFETPMTLLFLFGTFALCLFVAPTFQTMYASVDIVQPLSLRAFLLPERPYIGLVLMLVLAFLGLRPVFRLSDKDSRRLLLIGRTMLLTTVSVLLLLAVVGS